MGDIIFWTIIRTAITLGAVWFLKYQVEDQLWWLITIAAVYGIIIHPLIIGLRKFDLKNKNLKDSIICSNCKHFDSSALLCMKHDKHPAENYIPCDGIHWEPK